ncbi:MAG: hypothetical protein ABJP66_15890 [Hyphomicrobiales bacterium]
MGNYHPNHNTYDVNKTDVDVDVDVDLDYTNTSKSSQSYLDNDTFDIDLQHYAKVDELLVSKGAIVYDPGDDISVEDALNDALNGAGNDAGVGLNNTNQLLDDDWSSGTHVANNSPFEQIAYSYGGDAQADDGIASGGEFNVWAGDDAAVSGAASAAANANNSTDAFINELVQGANIANNSVDMTIVGGGMLTESVGEDEG